MTRAPGYTGGKPGLKPDGGTATGLGLGLGGPHPPPCTSPPHPWVYILELPVGGCCGVGNGRPSPGPAPWAPCPCCWLEGWAAGPSCTVNLCCCDVICRVQGCWRAGANLVEWGAGWETVGAGGIGRNRGLGLGNGSKETGSAGLAECWCLRLLFSHDLAQILLGHAQPG